MMNDDYDQLINHHHNSNNEPNSDYDYPINTKKTVWNGRPTIPLKKFTNNNNHNNGKFEYFHHQTNKQIPNILDIVIPIIPEKNFNNNNNNDEKDDDDDDLHRKQSFYYDIPKNIPINNNSHNVNKLNAKSMINLSTSFSSTLSLNKNLLLNEQQQLKKPQLPKKSSFIRKKIQANYNNNNNNNNKSNENNYENLPNQTLTLNRYHKSKPIPQPDNNLTTTTAQSNLTTTSETFKSLTLPRPPKTTTTTNKNSDKKIINYNQDNPDDDDDDDFNDYDYDYVCLESKKKLNEDDERIKLLLSNQYHYRYENLVIQSNSFNTKLLSTTPTTTTATNQLTKIESIKQFYRQQIFSAQRNFHQWCCLTIEIILNHRQYKPEVYFNIVKHILLSGQNLLNTMKLYTKQFKQINNSNSNDDKIKELDQFSIKFLDQLKHIVVHTKRLTISSTKSSSTTTTLNKIKNPKSIDNLIEHIKLSTEMSESIRKIFQ